MLLTSRSDFEQLIVLRLTEAKLLMDQNQDWDGAYYLAGYAIEFAFKVRIISQLTKTGTFPDRKLVDNFYKHDLEVLRQSAGLESEMKMFMQEDANFRNQWQIVKDWNEQSRYRFGTTEQAAKDLYEAIEIGVLPWIKARW